MRFRFALFLRFRRVLIHYCFRIVLPVSFYRPIPLILRRLNWLPLQWHQSSIGVCNMSSESSGEYNVSESDGVPLATQHSGRREGVVSQMCRTYWRVSENCRNYAVYAHLRNWYHLAFQMIRLEAQKEAEPVITVSLGIYMALNLSLSPITSVIQLVQPWPPAQVPLQNRKTSVQQIQQDWQCQNIWQKINDRVHPGTVSCAGLDQRRSA